MLQPFPREFNQNASRITHTHSYYITRTHTNARHTDTGYNTDTFHVSSVGLDDHQRNFVESGDCEDCTLDRDEKSEQTFPEFCHADLSTIRIDS